MRTVRKPDSSAYETRPELSDIEEYIGRRAPAAPAAREDTFVNDEKWSYKDLARVLDFEALHISQDRRADIINRNFKVSPARYYQALNRLIDTPEALAYDALLVTRLRNARDLRREERASRRFTRRRG